MKSNPIVNSVRLLPSSLGWTAALAALLMFTTSRCVAQGVDGTYQVSEAWSMTVMIPPGYPTGPRTFTKTGTARGTIQVVGGSYNLVNTTGAAKVGAVDATLQSDGLGGFEADGHPVVYGIGSKGSTFYVIAKLGFTVIAVPVGNNFGFSLFQEDDEYSMSGTSLSDLEGQGTAIDGNDLEIDVSSVAKLTPSGAGGGGPTVDTKKPTIAITQPKSKASVSNAMCSVVGKAADNEAVASVTCWVNDSDPVPVSSGDNLADWTATVTLSPGPNIIMAYAMDTNGNVSATNSVTVNYLVTTPVLVEINGPGTVSPNYNTEDLVIGKVYKMSAKPGKGCVFDGWTGSTVSALAKLTFTMESNSVFMASFTDITPPVLAVKFPAAKHLVTNDVIDATGAAKDNVGVQTVFYQFNTNDWIMATGTTNWAATNLTLTAGTNIIRAYATDAAGNISKTNSISFKH